MYQAAWLVDVGYVTKASEGKFRLDYVETERFLEEALGRVRAVLFNGFDPSYGISPGLETFYEAMRRQGMEVRLHPMDPGPPGANRQRRVDVDLGAHLVWQASLPEIEAVVISAGDQDFIPAVELARDKLGKRVILFSYNAVVNRELAEAVDEWWHFEDQRARLAW
jgi:uncharacterized LabA/DUF88 family protein